MLDRVLGALASIPGRVSAWAANLTAPTLAGIGVVVLAGVGAGGYYAYRTYDYVQHDNDFCMSCHLMREPYELFARSAHQGLGCKECHQPTLVTRSRMALTQIVENPEELAAHAEVPNERCAHCHIDGDADKWRLIAGSAGHKAHLESDDPSLEGLQCVECHSTSLHEFAPIDRTCAQSGCHEDKKILLAGMSDLTIHCAACHSFLAPVNTAGARTAILGDDVEAAILPDREECFSCHAMRALVDMPRPDPHEGVCAACHNPHEQGTSAEAVRSCANAGCHTQAATLSPMHRGLQPGVLEDCTWCHKAHDFKVDGNRCLDCHQDLDRDSIDARAHALPDLVRPHAPGRQGSGEHEPASWVSFALSRLPVTGVGIGWWSHELRQVQQLPTFSHAQHRTVDCVNCHRSQDRHGGLSVVTLDDCRGCHHRAPLADDCARCHEASEMPTGAFRQVRAVTFSVGRPDPERVMSFPHETHGTIACGICHTEGLALSAANVDCTGCHQDHHDPKADCASCHRPPPARVHPTAEAHVTCSGASCHRNPPFRPVPQTRTACLVCHQELQSHRPGRICVECHSMPSPRGAGVERLS